MIHNIVAQDPHFTQIYNSSQYLNPALTGTFQGSYRINTSYRDQWQISTGTPMTTFNIGGDLKFELEENAGSGDVIGGGILFFGDRVGLLNYNTNQIALSGSYHKLLGEKKKQYLGIGIQGAMVQKEVSYENLTFQDQFNAIDGFTNPTGEILPSNNIGFGDLSLGINFSMAPIRDHYMNIGLAVFHILNPNVSYYERDELLSRQLNVEDRLASKWNFHSSYSYPYSEAINIEPRLLFMQQGDFNELSLNVLAKVRSLELDNQGFFLGPGIRMANSFSQKMIPESIMLTVGYEYRGVIIGASYDHSIMDISAGRNGFNAFEISVNYWGNYDNGTSMCPKF